MMMKRFTHGLINTKYSRPQLITQQWRALSINHNRLQQQVSSSNLQKNIARDFNKKEDKKESNTSMNMTFDELKQMGYETRGDIISKRISVNPNSMPHSMAFYSLITSLPLITGSAIFSFTATMDAANTDATTTNDVTDAASWISHDVLMNYQLNYSALLLVAYAAIHMGLNYGAFHLPPLTKQTSIDKTIEAQQQKQLDSEQTLINESILADNNRERTEMLARSKYAPDSPTGWGRMLMALYPMGIAFASFSLPVLPSGVILIVGHLTTALMDSWMAYQGLAPRWYPAMRLAVAIIIISSLSISLFFYIFSTALETIQKNTQELAEGAEEINTIPVRDRIYTTRPSRPKLPIVSRSQEADSESNSKDEIDFEKALKDMEKSK